MNYRVKVTRCRFYTILFCLSFLLLSTRLMSASQEITLLEQSNFFPLNDAAHFIHNMEIKNRKTISQTYIQSDYSDEELAKALSGIAVSVNGEQFHSKITIASMKHFKQIIPLQNRNVPADIMSNALTEYGVNTAYNPNTEQTIKPQIVIGIDDRKQITNTVNRSPYWHIGKLDIGCTGTLIGDNHVLTAGHCISDGNGNWYSNLDFAVAQNGNYKPWNKCSWKMAITTEAWYNNGNSNFDYGLIVLDCIANGGWLGFGPFIAGEHSITGYASEKSYATMWTDSGPVMSTNHRLCYQMDTSNGVSGSAIIDRDNYIRGVHTTGSPNNNCGTRITSEVYSTLHHWMETYP
ncbi:trypsin-like serine peptidase [Shewanella surugensis]|uniref:Serine protease n=1 Tax=Shewanella surugensis TaxID=212020 RepID=A0ABT0LJ13_9GAMM|nr:trypsin-like serine protease [Shewanella surugensis]MCL1127655.1 trypsin-like serine protease [Shewanella surugensis]